MSNKKSNNTPHEHFNPDPNFGLSAEQIRQRERDGLCNKTQKKYSKSYFNIFVNNVCTFFNLLGLIVVIALVVFARKDVKISNFFFVVIFASNILIGIIQEIRAKHCIDKLSIVSDKSINAIRNGTTINISPKDIVLDDILRLGLGNQVPTDCIILDGYVEVNEALLTGEADAVKKNPGDVLLAGSFVTAGTCRVRADKIGKDNYAEQLSEKAKKYKKPHSEIMNSLKFFIKSIGIIIVPIAILFMLKSTLISKTDISLAVMRTSTVVIGMIPSGMFLLTSLALAVGIIKLARHETLIQDLYSLEMLARVDTICFDKTGTITDGNMTVDHIESLVEDDLNYDAIISSMIAALPDDNQTSKALRARFGDTAVYRTTATLPFNSQRKYSAVSFENGYTYALGAPEFVLNKADFDKISNTIEEKAKKGLRVLLLAKSDVDTIQDKSTSRFSPVALITLSDNLRDDAIETVKWFKENDVEIKVISGDNPITVAEVAKRVGIEGAENYISLEGLSDEETFDAANRYTVFGRVSPEQKAILIKALKANGHVTAMTGDGVNDILALKEADCAVSVAAGSDAARNVSHIVLMNNNFNSMPKVVYEGRRVINNVQSSASLYLMKTFFTMIFSIIALVCMETYPFQLNQMILIEVFVIGVPSFFLSFQANDKKVEGNFISYVIGKSLPSALLMVINVVIVEIVGATLNTFDESVYTTMSVFALTFAGLISLFSICQPLNLYRTLLFTVNFAVVFGVFAVTVFNGFEMLEYVKLTPLSTYWHHLLILIGIIVVDVPLSKLFRFLFKNVKIKPLKQK